MIKHKREFGYRGRMWQYEYSLQDSHYVVELKLLDTTRMFTAKDMADLGIKLQKMQDEILDGKK